MAEYIDREALLNSICKKYCDCGYDGECPNCRLTEPIVAVLAADIAPVRHGKWMPFHAEFAGDIQYCSVCEIGFSDRTAYCPHCGAVMDGWRKEAAENE